MFPVVVLAAVLAVVPGVSRVPAADAGPARAYDVSWPNCGQALPTNGDLGIVGVNGGRPYENNPCLAAQFKWATSGPRRPAFYMNTSNPGTASRAVNWYAQRSPSAACSAADEGACAFNYGYNAAKHAFARAQAQTGAASRHTWWLDVETGNSWSTNRALNSDSIAGSITYLRTQGVPVGVYSTRYQWGQITGGVVIPDVPVWLAGARNGQEATRFCGPERSFTGGPVIMVQWVEHNFDHNHLCRPMPTTVTPPPAPAPATLEELIKQVPDDLAQGLRKLLGQK